MSLRKSLRFVLGHPGRLLPTLLLLLAASGLSAQISSSRYPGSRSGTSTSQDPFEQQEAANRRAQEEAQKAAEEQARRDLQEPRTRIPLIWNTGAWDWVADITRRLVRDTQWTLYVPTIEERGVFGGKLPGPTPKLPSDTEKNVLTLFLVHSSTVNAFATSENRIYVTRGLLEFVRSDDELAGVLGHEIGHLAGGHHRRLARKQSLLTALGTIGGILASGGGDGLLPGMALGRTLGLKYNRQAENEADRLGLAMMKEAGYHPVGMLEFMEHLGEDSDGSPEDPLSVFFSTHPPTSQRAAYFRKEVDAIGGQMAPAGLSFDFSRNLYAPRVDGSEEEDELPSQPGTRPSTGPASLRLDTLLEKDFKWRRAEAGRPLQQGFPKGASLYRFEGWNPLPETFERSGAAILPGKQGLLMGPGATLLGPEIPLDPNTSYLISCRLQGRGEKIRAFVGLELYGEGGKKLGVVYSASPGIFLDEEDRRLFGVTHPFGRLEATRQKAPVTGRLVVRTGRRGEGQLTLGELAFLPVGRDEEIWKQVGRIEGSSLVKAEELMEFQKLPEVGSKKQP